MGFGHASQDAVVPVSSGSRACPRVDGASIQRAGGVRDDQIRVDDQANAEARAARARTVRAVEAECTWFDFSKANATVRAGELFGINVLITGIRVHGEHAAFTETEGYFGRVDDATALGLVVKHEAINNDFNGVPLLLVEVNFFVEPSDGSIHSDANETVLAGVLEDFFVLALLVDHARSKEHEARALLLKDGESDLLDRLSLHGATAIVAMGVTYPGVEKPEVVVNLGNRADGGARVVGNAFLINRNRR